MDTAEDVIEAFEEFNHDIQRDTEYIEDCITDIHDSMKKLQNIISKNYVDDNEDAEYYIAYIINQIETPLRSIVSDLYAIYITSTNLYKGKLDFEQDFKSKHKPVPVRGENGIIHFDWRRK